MKRAILSAPAMFTEADLTAGQAAAIAAIRGEWALPMPGTVVAGGARLIDAVMFDSFDPAHIAPLGLPFAILGLWQWSGTGPLTEIAALDTGAFLAHLPAVPVLDGDGAPTGATLPAALHEPHRWAGWPGAF